MTSSMARLKKIKDRCPYNVNPLPYEFCENCMVNGCYPWNRNPMLLCSLMGGLLPAVISKDDEGNPIACRNYKIVDDGIWISHMKDLKSDAKSNEECRKRARDGKVKSSELLPAEYVIRRSRIR